jgi:transposase-like protein
VRLGLKPVANEASTLQLEHSERAHELGLLGNPELIALGQHDVRDRQRVAVIGFAWSAAMALAMRAPGRHLQHLQVICPGNLESACWSPRQRGFGLMPRSYPPEVRRQVIELARAGTRDQQLSVTFGVTETTIYNWLKQERIDRGEETGQTTDQQPELAAAKRRIKQLETELAVARKVNEVFLREGISPKGSSR